MGSEFAVPGVVNKNKFMNEEQIITELLRYIDDNFYNYAAMVTGEWGIGKTYFAKGMLRDAIIHHEVELNKADVNHKSRQLEYVTLYGCKTVDDVSSAFAWAITHRTTGKISNNRLFSMVLRNPTHRKKASGLIKSAGNELVQRFSINKLIFDVASEVFSLEDYIFIVDDLERCDCGINEVFGFLNQMVEHKGAKIIIFANEAEISDSSKDDKNHDFQYYYALQSNIDWPKKESPFLYANRESYNQKISIDELDRRRQVLFPDKQNNKEYLKIKEKLVGVTLEYVPSFKKILEEIIDSAKIDEDIKTDLRESLNEFVSIMNLRGHHNLRTFQFFLSKMEFLLNELRNIKFDEYYRQCVKKAVVNNTFLCAVDYKSNYENSQDPYSIVYSEQNHISKAIDSYVCKGSYDAELFEADIKSFIDGIIDKPNSDDPLEQLYSRYYYKTEEWCIRELDKLIDNLKHDRYRVSHYGRIFIVLTRLENIGFSKSYLQDAKNLMIQNIKNSKELIKYRIDEDLFYIDDKEFREKILVNIKEINTLLDSQYDINGSRSVSEILQCADWIDELEKFCNPQGSSYYKDIAVFYMASVDEWYKVLHETDPEGIDSFRHWLGELYPRSTVRSSFVKDQETLRKLYKALDEEKETDLIKKNTFKWLKFQIEEIFKTHSAEMIEEKDNEQEKEKDLGLEQ